MADRGDERFEAESSDRLDKLLAARASVGSRRRAAEAIATGKVSVEGRAVLPEEAGLPVAVGASITIAWNRPGSSIARSPDKAAAALRGLRIVYEDAAMIVVDKPPGLLTDAASRKQAAERDTVKKRLDALLRPRGQRSWVCHRIDRDTSGLVVFATSEAHHTVLHGQFLAHTPKRVYRVLVEGQPRDDRGELQQAGTWEDWMRWDDRRLIQEPCPPSAPQAALARASWRLVRTLGRGAELEVRLDTGRRNQIRLQAALRGMPLAGERLYRRGQPTLVEAPRQALHAAELEVRHPTSGAALRLSAPLPADLAAVAERLAATGASGAARPGREPTR